jgi:predicted GH43/DUF377 family glycosyl hydrolase
MSQQILVCLGKSGDVINILPLAYESAQHGQRIAIMSCEPFASVLDGCSYVDKIVFPGQPTEIDKAMEMAKKISDNVKCLQVVGPPELVKLYAYKPAGQEHAVTDSFQKEAWMLAGRFDDWRKNIPLVFDKRDKDREEAFVFAHLGHRKKKVMLLALGGSSSPFQYRDLLTELLTLKFNRQYDIIDISGIQCERIYDLLGLYEGAGCLVATDSAPLHLARAAGSLPVVALVNDAPSLWHGSSWRANHVGHIRYGDFIHRFRAVADAVSSIGKPGCWTIRKPAATTIHVWSGYELTEESKERHEAAKSSWVSLYEGGAVACPVDKGAIGRDSKTQFKEESRFPFVKDVLRLAVGRAGAQDTILLTRHDSKIGGGLPDGPCYSHRTIVGKGGEKLSSHIDLFSFTKAWWLEHQHEYPDMVMGRDLYWGKCLAELIKLHGGKEVRGLCSRPAGAVIQHEKVPAYYGYNAHHAREFLTKNNLVHTSKPVTSQATATVLNPKSLPPFAYNPSIIRYRNRLLVCFRFHIAGTLSTRLGIAELDDRLSVKKWGQLQMNDEQAAHSYEDARLFLYQDNLWISYVESKYPKHLECVVKYAEMFEGDRGWRTATPYQPRYGKNDWTGMEKNWTPFESSGKLHFIYDNTTVLEVDGDYCSEIKIEPASWDYGDIRGGNIIPWKGGLLRTFHSRMDNEMPPHYWRYYVGAMTMESVAPFKVTGITKEPLLKGSEEGGSLDCFHHKPKVVFPLGLQAMDGGVLISVGVNDCESAVVRMNEPELKL